MTTYFIAFCESYLFTVGIQSQDFAMPLVLFKYLKIGLNCYRCNYFTHDLLMKWCYLKYDKNSSQGTLSLAEKAQSYRWVKYD